MIIWIENLLLLQQVSNQISINYPHGGTAEDGEWNYYERKIDNLPMAASHAYWQCDDDSWEQLRWGPLRRLPWTWYSWNKFLFKSFAQSNISSSFIKSHNYSSFNLKIPINFAFFFAHKQLVQAVKACKQPEKPSLMHISNIKGDKFFVKLVATVLAVKAPREFISSSVFKHGVDSNHFGKAKCRWRKPFASVDAVKVRGVCGMSWNGWLKWTDSGKVVAVVN